MPRLLLLAALALAGVVSSPAFAESSGTPVTWGGLGIVGLGILVVVVVSGLLVLALSFFGSGYDH